MTPSSNDSPTTNSKQKRNALVIWLVLAPVIFSTLVCCGQLALMLYHEYQAYPSADTRSRLSANYIAWPYQEIPPIDIAAFMKDLQKEQNLFGMPVLPPITAVEEGRIVIAPTSKTPTADVTPAPTGNRAAPTSALPTISHTPRSILTLTPTPTSPPTATPSPSATHSLVPPQPVPTDTEEPPRPAPPTATATKHPPLPSQTPTNTLEKPSSTPVTPSPTNPPEPPVETTEAPLPTYALVRPIAENNGVSEVDPNGQGCLAYFGYRNNNAVEVDIPLGERNYFSEPYIFIDPDPPPTHFFLERVSPAFFVIWNTGRPFTWFLDGRQATAEWCGLPLP